MAVAVSQNSPATRKRQRREIIDGRLREADNEGRLATPVSPSAPDVMPAEAGIQ
jgi:hypothetical protein